MFRLCKQGAYLVDLTLASIHNIFKQDQLIGKMVDCQYKPEKIVS